MTRTPPVVTDPGPAPLPDCIGKQPFANPQQAREAARRKIGRIHYRCPHCHSWHVGNAAPRSATAKRSRAARRKHPP